VSVLAIDLETKNFAHEIGGWGNTHMFRVSTVCTYDGDKGTVYVDKSLDDYKKPNTIVKSLSDLKYDLDDHFEKGGILLGHNIVAFDLPVLKNAMDIYCIKKYLDNEAYIDTSRILSKEYKERFSLNNLVQHTLKSEKLMESAEAPVMWKAGKYTEVVDYCLKDCELVYDLWKYGQNNKVVKGFSLEQEELLDLGVDW
jgi:DEAD/DEAH box helicase domain-containing protein|tara:strand:+ start:2168 stop:2761 length:594 start_codon:yes stop_codon:yes gene_type:complete